MANRLALISLLLPIFSCLGQKHWHDLRVVCLHPSGKSLPCKVEMVVEAKSKEPVPWDFVGDSSMQVIRLQGSAFVHLTARIANSKSSFSTHLPVFVIWSQQVAIIPIDLGISGPRPTLLVPTWKAKLSEAVCSANSTAVFEMEVAPINYNWAPIRLRFAKGSCEIVVRELPEGRYRLILYKEGEPVAIDVVWRGVRSDSEKAVELF